ncbi:MAG: DUF4397 domain-containing protein [Anaerolineae bacterium]|nr:DUF4397 domain-containing protein [Anaerolineae bacterium]
MRRSLSLPLALTALALSLAACGGDADTPAPSQTPPPSPAPTETAQPSPTPFAETVTGLALAPDEAAWLRIVNASPDLPQVSVYLDNLLVVAALRPGQYQQSPQKVPAGDGALRVVPAGDDAAPALFEAPISLPVGAAQVIVLAGRAGDFRLIIASEDTSPLPKATARLQIVNALPDAGTLTVQDGQRTIFSALAFGEVSEALTLAEKGHDLTLLTADAALAEFEFYGMARYAYTVVLFPDPEAGVEPGGVARVELRSRVEDEAQIRVMHASPDLPPVDVYLDDISLAESLAYRVASAWTTRRAATYQLRLLPAGEPDAAPLLVKQIALRADEAASLVLLGTQGRLRVTAVAEDLSPTPVNAARLLFVNAAPDTISVRVSTYSGEVPNLRPVPFGAASRPLVYPAGISAFVIETGSADSPREIDLLPERDWQAGVVYAVIITDTPDAPPVVLETETGVGDTMLAAEGVVPLESAPPSASGWGPGARVFAVRLVNALTDAAPVDLLADGAPILESVSPYTATAYHDLGAPPDRLEIRQSASGAVLFSDAMSLPPAPEGTYLTLYVFRDSQTVRLEAATERALQVPDNYALLRVFHAAPGAPALRVLRAPTPTPSSTPSPAPPVSPGAPTPTAPLPETSLPVGEKEESGAVPDILLDSIDFRMIVDPVLIPVGTHELRIVERVSTREVAALTVTLAPRTAYELLLLPDGGGQGVRAVLVTHRR